MNMARLLDGALEMLVLGALSSGSKDADEIMHEIRRSAGEPLSIETDVVYPVLYRLEQKAFIAGEWRRGTPGLGPRHYSVTQRGATLLKENQAGWQRFALLVERMLQPALPSGGVIHAFGPSAMPGAD